MLRTLWTITKLGVFIAAGVWLSMQPGQTELHWMGYDVDVRTGFLIFCVLCFSIVFAWLYRFWIALKATPRTIARKLDARAQDQALQAVSHGLSAIAAGDVHSAEKQADRARRLIKNDHGLVPLLSGMTARLKGDSVAAENAFRELLNTKQTAFIGVRGLLQLSIDRHQHDQALVLARQAYRMHPKQAWILKTLYALELRARHWNEAQDILNKIEKIKSIDAVHAKADRAAMLLARASEAQNRGTADQAYLLTREAYNAAPAFLPAVLGYLPFLIRRSERKGAMKVIEKAWGTAPHPELKDAWLKLAPEGTNTPAKEYQWLQKLSQANPDHEDSHLMLAESALVQNLTGAARTHIDAAILARKSGRAMRMMATLEEKLDHQNAADLFMESANSAAPDRVWVCTESGRIYANWMPFAHPHNSFNTIVWDDPSQARRAPSIITALPDQGDALQLIESRAA
jgi:HemY protein